jgi:hypothetical protein
MEERKKSHLKAFEDAIRHWQATGEVPIEERE